MRKGKVKPWRGYEFLHENGDDVVIDNHYKKNCTVYPDGCDPTPAAVKRFIKKLPELIEMLKAIDVSRAHAASWHGSGRQFVPLLEALSKSTTPKKRKPGVREGA